MIRASSPWTNSHIIYPEDDDLHEVYALYAICDELVVSVGTATEVCDAASLHGSTSDFLDIQLLQDRITSLSQESILLKRDVTEKDRCIN